MASSKELKLNALYWELGELSFMKEVIAYQVGIENNEWFTEVP